jgi:deazaflavin-dependent oxidoreductase (nitroreductase family)
MALLFLVGRKTGEPRPTPLLYMKNAEDLVIVASFYGSPKHPAWYHNVLANPEFDVRVDRRRYRVRARKATREEREKLWPRLVEHYPGYAGYQARTEREIPVMILSPLAEA